MIRLKGKITISRVSGAPDSDEVRVRIEDDDAHVTAIEAHMSLLDYARALTGTGYVDCEFEFNDSGRVGTIGENKEELVPVPPYDKRDKAGEWITAALKPFDADGWTARRSDLQNHHRSSRKDGQDYQSVVFFRNVKRAAE